MMFLAIASPRPEPVRFVVKYGSKTRDTSSETIPWVVESDRLRSTSRIPPEVKRPARRQREDVVIRLVAVRKIDPTARLHRYEVRNKCFVTLVDRGVRGAGPFEGFAWSDLEIDHAPPARRGVPRLRHPQAPDVRRRATGATSLGRVTRTVTTLAPVWALRPMFIVSIRISVNANANANASPGFSCARVCIVDISIRTNRPPEW